MLLGSAATLSYIEDPGGAFSDNTYEGGIANILLSGHNVANVKNYDERLLQKDVIKNDRRKIDVIVLGSSRSMQLRSSEFSGQTFFNHGVSGASIEDHIAILDLYQEKGTIPKTIIIGVDPWILNANNNQNRWTSLKQEYQNGIARICSTSLQYNPDSENIGSNIDRYFSLISRPIIIASIMEIFRESYYPTDCDELDVAVRLKDGAFSDPSSSRIKTIGQIDSSANEYANRNPIYSLGNFTYIDKDSKTRFESTIHYLKTKNVTVILFLPPYHPIVYQKMKTDSRYMIVGEVERYFKDFALMENIQTVGSYDPNLLNLSSIDFYDGQHPSRETIKKIFAEVNISK